MSGSIGSNAFNIGSDTTLTWISAGGVVNATILISFDARQMVAALDSTAINGQNLFRDVEKGWELSFEFDRQNAVIDNYFAVKEANRYLGIAPPVVTINETTSNTDGTISIFRYDGVTMRLDTIGSRKGDSKVEPKVSARAAHRVQVQ